MIPHFSMVIRWSEEDQVYVVLLPEFPDVSKPCTHGETYEAAAQSGREVIELLVGEYQAQGKPLPEPWSTLAVSG